MRITVDPGLLDEIIAHARDCFPEEACGFLIGRSGTVERFVPAPNALRSQTAFEVEAQFLFDLFRQLRSSGEDLLAICHSHPKGPAVPSARDVAEAHYPGCAYVIVSLAEAEPDIRAYRIVGREVLEMELHAKL